MTNPIYEPKGAAREYGELALNIYTGCPHRCFYCYAPMVLHKDRDAFHADVRPRPGIVEAVKKQLEKTGMTGKTVHLCFTCDPFPFGYDCTPTLEIIDLLKKSGNHVQILTKGISLECLNMLDGNDWYGITVDGAGFPQGRHYVCRPQDRYKVLKMAHDRGIKTWISFEPVVDALGVLAAIEGLPEYCVPDIIKIGKLNYHQPPEPIDWAKFGQEVVDLCEQRRIPYYIKDSLRKEMEKHG